MPRLGRHQSIARSSRSRIDSQRSFEFRHKCGSCSLQKLLAEEPLHHQEPVIDLAVGERVHALRIGLSLDLAPTVACLAFPEILGVGVHAIAAQDAALAAALLAMNPAGLGHGDTFRHTARCLWCRALTNPRNNSTSFMLPSKVA